MYSARLIHLLLVALGFIAAAQATFLNDNTGPDAALRIRQDGDGETTPSPSASEPSATPSDIQSDPSPSPSPSTPSEPDETTTTTEDPPTTRPPTSTPTTTDAPETTPSTSESVSEPGQSETTRSDDEGTTTTSEEESQVSSRRSTMTTIIVITSTDSEGRQTEITSASEVISTPSLAPGQDNSSGGGMPENTRNIVIGVVCGVGGAIVLGALGFVAWRVWGRKKKAEENDGLMDYHTAGTSAFNNEAKPDAMSNSTGPSRSPFQTTLEDYHRPGQVNASSNF